jgi:hypothetical protein
MYKRCQNNKNGGEQEMGILFSISSSLARFCLAPVPLLRLSFVSPPFSPSLLSLPSLPLFYHIRYNKLQKVLEKVSKHVWFTNPAIRSVYASSCQKSNNEDLKNYRRERRKEWERSGERRRGDGEGRREKGRGKGKGEGGRGKGEGGREKGEGRREKG